MSDRRGFFGLMVGFLLAPVVPKASATIAFYPSSAQSTLGRLAAESERAEARLKVYCRAFHFESLEK